MFKKKDFLSPAKQGNSKNLNTNLWTPNCDQKLQLYTVLRSSTQFSSLIKKIVKITYKCLIRLQVSTLLLLIINALALFLGRVLALTLAPEVRSQHFAVWLNQRKVSGEHVADRTNFVGR